MPPSPPPAEVKPRLPRSRPYLRLLWLLPIHPSEAAYARAHGAEALERLFDDAGVMYADPQRPAVV